jgi:MoaA/NifB/PqqE/SkfB family radical SAM enzyme
MIPQSAHNHTRTFNLSVEKLFSQAMRISGMNPSDLIFWLRTYFRQKSKAGIRDKQKSPCLTVPPIMIFSGTSRCNLNCKGCYAMAKAEHEKELPLSRVETLFREASDLGVGVIMIAGGEPLMKPEILWAAAAQKDIIFPVFTNGLLLNEGSISFFRKHRNLIPILSAEGGQHRTDNRRGNGVYTQVLRRMETLNKAGQWYGMSFTLTRNNFEEVTHPVWLKSHCDLGARIFFMVDYVPQSKAEEDLCLTPEQKAQLPVRIEELKAAHQALFVSLPGDEEKFGGCLAGGRGFIHISASGRLEACPFAPWSDTSVQDLSLKEALQSPFMQVIRQSHHLLGESQGGCTLWENQEWVMKQLGRPAQTTDMHVANIA